MRLTIRRSRRLALLTCATGTTQQWGFNLISAGGTGPCDLYAAGGTPCVAAHSTVRALYSAPPDPTSTSSR